MQCQASLDIHVEIKNLISEAKKIVVNDPKTALEICQEAYKKSIDIEYRYGEGYSLAEMAYACRIISMYPESLRNGYKALEVFREIKDKDGQAKALNLLGIIYFYYGEFKQALEYFWEALKLSKIRKNFFLLPRILNNIGEVYREAADYDNAMKAYEEALEISREHGYNMNIACILSNIGDIHYNEKDFDKAWDYFTKSSEYYLKESEAYLVAELGTKIGKALFKMGNEEEARRYLHSSIHQLESIENNFYLIEALICLGEIEINKDSNDFLMYFQDALEYAKKGNARKKTSLIYNILYNFYYEKDDYKKAIEYLQKYHFVEKEIEASNITLKLEMLKFDFEYPREKDELEKFKSINEKLESEIATEKIKLMKLKEHNVLLEKKVLIDELTGIPNRRRINSYLKQLWANKEKHNTRITLFILDIDKFKFFNDHWGHLQGDECLKRISNALRSIQHRRDDFFGRYGGEEFIYIVRDIGFDEARRLGEELREAIEKLAIKYNEKDSNTVTMSIGGAYGELSDFRDIYDIIEKADRELYKVKNDGRNKVFITKK